MSLKYIKGLVGVSAIALLPAAQAWAVGTEAGTPVNNTFTLTYEVNGSGTPVTLPDDPAHDANFVVDRIIDVLVEAPAPDTATGPVGGTVEQIFTVTNEGNATQGMLISITEDGADEFDVTGNSILEYSVDGGTTWVALPASGLTPDVAADDSILIRVTTTVPSGASGDEAEYALIATVAEPTTPPAGGGAAGTAVTETPAGNTNGAGTIETVFRDDAGTQPDFTVAEADTDGKHFDTARVVTQSANVTAAKSVALLSPNTASAAACSSISTAAIPEANALYTPGACVEYTISVTNSGTADATDIIIDDTLSTDLEYVSIDVSNLTGTDASAITTGTDCAGAGACDVQMTDGTVPAPSGAATSVTRVLVIRARVK